MFNSLKVIELSTVLAGPHVGMFFAELGADVLKIEHPNQPDVTRSWKLPSEDANDPVPAYFASVNYKKRYRQLDLSSAEGKAEMRHLLADCDILLLNFKRGDDAKFGLTYEEIAAINPRTIVGKITGFGDDSDRVAYDLILQAESGFMAMNGTPGSGPVKMPVALIDVLAAHHLKEGLLVALLQRQQTGKGSVVSVSLYDAAVSSLVNQASNYLMGGHVPQRIGSLHPNIAPYGEIFTTSDGKQVTFAIGSDRHFAGLCDIVGLPELAADMRFADNPSRVKHRTELFDLLAEAIIRFSAEDLNRHAQQRHIPMGIIRSLDAVFSEESAQRLIRKETIAGKETQRVTSIAFHISRRPGRDPDGMEIRTPANATEWEAYYDLRYRVLREPLGKERGSERNDGDATGIHFGLYDQGVLRAIARLDQVDATTCQVRFVAVESDLQGKGLGKAIMDAVERRGSNEGYMQMILHARDYALDFYKKLGYTVVGPSYKLFGVLQHYEMYKVLKV